MLRPYEPSWPAPFPMPHMAVVHLCYCNKYLVPNVQLVAHQSQYMPTIISKSVSSATQIIIITMDLDANTDNSVSKLAYGTKETVNCSANSSQSCSYKWKWIDEGHEEVVSTSSALIPSRPGLYKCEAECSIRGKQCTLLSGQILVTEETGKNISTSTNLFKFYCFAG